MKERIQRLRDAYFNLSHTKHRMVKDLTILYDNQLHGVSVVIRKAQALALFLDEIQAVIMDDELIVGLQTVLGHLQTGQNVLGSFDYELLSSPRQIMRYPIFLTIFPKMN